MGREFVFKEAYVHKSGSASKGEKNHLDLEDEKEAQMTTRLYLEDSYMKDFEAIVELSLDQGVVLDRTAFYPGGGGQPNDFGSLEFSKGKAAVQEMQVVSGQVIHVIEPGLEINPGDQVHGELDWERRYQLMRTHTAMHILCGVIWKDYGASVTGGNMQPLRGRMDFEFEHMQKELVSDIERRINMEVEADRAITIEILPREEAFKIPDLIRTKINLLPEHIQEVRVVEIEGLDLQADGGTHVARTGEVGPLRIVDYKSKGKINKRLVVELESRGNNVQSC
jgi:misacylated tRNA(Ala) deacylase